MNIVTIFVVFFYNSFYCLEKITTFAKLKF